MTCRKIFKNIRKEDSMYLSEKRIILVDTYVFKTLENKKKINNICTYP